VADSLVRVFSHIGMCVSDVERSKRFYCDGLGFRQVVAFKVGNEVGPTMEVEGEIVLNSVFIRRDGVSIELLGFESPPHHGDGKRRPMNHLGLTHLSMLVDDVDKVAAHAVECGGSIVDSTRATSPAGDFIFILDPDGIRVELMRLAAGPVPTGD
jgi:glyoxylase I family protein